MGNLIEAFLEEKQISALEFNSTSLRLENRDWEEKGGLESLKGCTEQRTHESPSELLRRYAEVKEKLTK